MKTTHIENEIQVLHKYPLPNRYESTGRFQKTLINQKQSETSLNWQHQSDSVLFEAKGKQLLS